MSLFFFDITALFITFLIAWFGWWLRGCYDRYRDKYRHTHGSWYHRIWEFFFFEDESL